MGMFKFHFDSLFPHRAMMLDLGNFRTGAVVVASPIGDASLYRYFGCNDSRLWPWAITFEVTSPKDHVIDVPVGDGGASRPYVIVLPHNGSQPGWYHFHDKPIAKFQILLDALSRQEKLYLDAKIKDPRELAQKIDEMKANQEYMKTSNAVKISREE